MPHSETAEAMSSPSAVKDEPMEDNAIPIDVAPATEVKDVEMDSTRPEEAKKEVKLEELFDMESDDEFPSSAPLPAPSSQIVPNDLIGLKASDPEVMRSFYQRLFPWRYLFQWLNHSPTPTNDFGNREFAFTLQNDAYLRYQSFATADL